MTKSNVFEAKNLKDLPKYKIDSNEFKKSEQDRKNLKKAKSNYAASMYGFLGPNWKKASYLLRVFNVPLDIDIRSYFQKMAKEKGLIN